VQFNKAQCHEHEWWSADIAPSALNLGKRWAYPIHGDPNENSMKAFDHL